MKITDIGKEIRDATHLKLIVLKKAVSYHEKKTKLNLKFPGSGPSTELSNNQPENMNIDARKMKRRAGFPTRTGALTPHSLKLRA